MHHFRRCLIGLCLLGPALPAAALGPNDVFLLVNRNVAASREVADHYCRQRGVPLEHVISLDLPTGEDISREDYRTRLVEPLRAALKDRRDQAKVLLSVYGVPLRVGPQPPTEPEKAEAAKLQPEIDRLRGERTRLQKELAGAAEARNADGIEPKRQDLAAVTRQLGQLEEQQRRLVHAESAASVDSELMMLWWDGYELSRWQINLLYFQVPPKFRQGKSPILMTARLDGPTPEVAKRLVDDAVAVERKGLTGRVYLDARGLRYDPASDAGYGPDGYDESLRETARLLKDEAGLPVTLDDRPELFAPGSCPDCALYCGWYSLANYVACCRFVPGAVAYHIASFEAVSLRDPKSKQWCKSLLENGVAATLGPVGEPYTIGFPKPAEFFGFLATGRWTLVECYAQSTLFTSWMMTLIGDPLYNPFARNARLPADRVRPSPAGGKFFLDLVGATE